MANEIESFSLVEGGPLYRLMRRAGLPGGSRGLMILGFALALLTWLPLAVLCAVDHARLGGVAVSFIGSIATHTRALIVIPLLFVAEAWFGPRTRDALRDVVDSNLVKPEEVPRLAAGLRRVIRWRDAWLPEIVLAGLAITTVVSGLSLDPSPDLSTWRATGSGPARLTLAGWWYSLVSIPVFQFLLWRWCWRLVIWYAFLARLAGLRLQLIPTHPDGAGGLGGLGIAHTALGTLAFAGSALLSASFAEEILFGGAKLQNFVLPLAGAVIGSVLVLLGPLALFMPRILATKQHGLFEYGALAATYTRAFDRKWLRGGAPPDEPLLGSADIQSLADLANSYAVIRGMNIVPVAGYQLVLMVAAAILPMIPLLLTVYPLDELVLKSVKSVVGL